MNIYLLNLPYQVTYEGLALDRPQSRIIYDAAGRKHATLNGRVSRGVFTSDVMLYVGGYVVINDSIDRFNAPPTHPAARLRKMSMFSLK